MLGIWKTQAAKPFQRLCSTAQGLPAGCQLSAQGLCSVDQAVQHLLPTAVATLSGCSVASLIQMQDLLKFPQCMLSEEAQITCREELCQEMPQSW